MVLILFFVAWSALAEDLVMKCTSPSGKSVTVYKIQKGLFGDKYLFREKIDWKPWCNDTDAMTKRLREAGMKNAKSLYLNIEKGDNAASCKSGFSFQDSDGINQVYHRFSVLDFFSFRYTTSIGKDKNSNRFVTRVSQGIQL